MTKIILGFLSVFFMTTSHAFKLESSSIKEGEKIKERYAYSEFGCRGNNVSPELKWSGAPSGTKSFAVTVYDPDAPTGSGWWHWTAFNLPPQLNHLREGIGVNSTSLPSSKIIYGMTDFGFNHYGGPCPPKGDKPHRYIFTVYALDIEHINLTEQASGAMVGFYLNQHTIEKASITALYGR